MFENWCRPDRNGDRTCLLRGERHLVDLIESQIIPGMIHRMEKDAGQAVKTLNQYLRTQETCERDEPFIRRRFRADFLRHWGWAFAERARAYQSTDGPWEPDWYGNLPELTEGAKPDAWDEARRAVAALDAFDTFGRGVAAHARAARETVATFNAACAAAGTTPEEVLTAEYEARNDHIFGPLELGEIEAAETAGTARLIVGIGNRAALAQARADVLCPILAELGAPSRRGPADRWGQLVGADENA